MDVVEFCTTVNMVWLDRFFWGRPFGDSGFIHDKLVSSQIRSKKSTTLVEYVDEIFDFIDADNSGEVSRAEIFDFVEKMGPSREELGKEVEILFARYESYRMTQTDPISPKVIFAPSPRIFPCVPRRISDVSPTYLVRISCQHGVLCKFV